jgi:glutaconate CoA-transferase subunit B
MMNDDTSAYSAKELMIVRAARELLDGEVVFVGIGLPNLACNLARRTHAPNLVLIYESGAVGAKPDRLPVSIGDPCLVKGAVSACSMADVFGLYLQGGRVDVGFLGCAQIDRHGNVNTTVIGDYHHPKVRLPGSGGACEIAIHSKKVIIITPQKKRIFRPVVDFITSPGHIAHCRNRVNWGMPGRGPVIVITDMAVFNFDESRGEMILKGTHPGIKTEAVLGEVGWDLCQNPQLEETPPPTQEELQIIREELDPHHRYI